MSSSNLVPTNSSVIIYRVGHFLWIKKRSKPSEIEYQFFLTKKYHSISSFGFLEHEIHSQWDLKAVEFECQKQFGFRTEFLN